MNHNKIQNFGEQHPLFFHPEMEQWRKECPTNTVLGIHAYSERGHCIWCKVANHKK